MFGSGGIAKLSLREQNDALQQELARVTTESAVRGERIQALEDAIAHGQESEAKLARQCAAHAEQRHRYEAALRDAAAAHSGFVAQLKNTKKVAEEQDRQLDRHRAEAAEAASRLRTLDEECKKGRATIATLTATVARGDEAIRTATRLRDDLAKRERTIKAQAAALAEAREAVERSATQTKAQDAALKDAVSAHGKQLAKLELQLNSRDASITAAAEHRESAASMTAELIRLMAAVGVRWLGGATPLAVARVDYEGTALDLKAIVQLANELPLDFSVALGASGEVELRLGPNANPDVAAILPPLLARMAGSDSSA